MKKWAFPLLLCGSIGQAAKLNCDAQVSNIFDIQGIGHTSDMVGQLVTVKGVVTGDFRGSKALHGFFIQQLNADNNPQTSEGLFVHHTDLQQKIQPGDLVMVNGRVSEKFEVTQLTKVSAVKVCEQQLTLPEPVLLELPLKDFDLEQVEGMRVGFKQPPVINDLYSYVKFGELSVSSQLLYRPTALYRPGKDVMQLRERNAQDEVIIDDGSGVSFPLPVPVGNDGKTPVSAENTLELGQKVDSLGVMHYAYGKYKIQPTEPLKVFPQTTKKVPDNVGGNFKVANFNLQNLFTTIDVGGENCGPKRNFVCRGADSEAELDRQIKKIVTAINTADASIMGLQELENNSGSAAYLVDALNKHAQQNKWSYIKTGVLGEDVIKVGLIYQHQQVKPLGELALLTSKLVADFDESKTRIAIAQTFEAPSGDKINVAVAHLKSKSCSDATDSNLDQHDGQGCYNPTRVKAAAQVAAWLNGDPTGQNVKATVFVGDLNSYQQEDPIETLRQNGWHNVAEKYLGPYNWTASYRGRVGSLDYVLANQAAMEMTTGLTQWHINSTHSALFGYNLEPLSDDLPRPENFYQVSPFSSSDHDMVIAGFDW